MEGCVIKSSIRSLNKPDEISDAKNPRVNEVTSQKSVLENISSTLSTTDVIYKINRNITNPVHNWQDKNDIIEISRNDEGNSLLNENIDSISTTDTSAILNELVNQKKEKIVEDLKNSESTSSVIEFANRMTKPLRSRVSCRKPTTRSNDAKKKTGKNIAQKVLVEKQIRSVRTCNRPVILLRSNKRKGTSILSDNLSNLNRQIPDENEITKTFNNGKIDEKENCDTDKENIVGKLVKNSDPLIIVNDQGGGDEIKKKKTIPFESLSLMEKILIREHEMLDNICNDRVQSTHQNDDNEALSNEQKSLVNETGDSMKIEVLPKKRYHRRKCSEPFKNERVQTRQSRSITIMQNKNEYKYFSEVPKTVKCNPSESEEGSDGKQAVEECSIICSPDINMNDQVEEMFSNENKTLDIGLLDEETNYKLEFDNERLNFTEINLADEIPMCNKNDPKSMGIVDSKISLEEINCSITNTKNSQSFKKRRQENADDNPKRKLRHVNAETMPVYLSRIAVTNIESKGKLSDTNQDKTEEKEKSLVVIEKEMQHCSNNIPLHAKSDRAADPRYSYFSNTDSEETLSNVESVPNSPAQDVWPKAVGKNLNLSKKCVKLNSGRSSSRRKDTSLVENKIPTDVNLSITEKIHNMELKSISKRKQRLQTESCSTLNCGTKRDQSELRYYVETTVNENPSCISDRSETKIENDPGNDGLGGLQETPWLRHYERPNKSLSDTGKNDSEFDDNRKENSFQQSHEVYHQRQKSVEKSSKKKTRKPSIADNSIVDNLHAAEGYACRNQSGKVSQPVYNLQYKKRGRPRKQNGQGSKINSEGNKRSWSSASGCGLSKLELERLFFKFLQDGHFRMDPGHSPIIIPNNNLYENFSPRMECYDPKRLYNMQPHTRETTTNSENKIPTNNDASRFYPSNSTQATGEFEQRMRTMNPNSSNYSNELMGQTTYSKNLNPYNTHTNMHSYTNSENTSGYNAIAHTNSVSNYMQSGYGMVSNYHQNLYSNNTNVMGNNNSYSNNFCGIMNSHGSTNDVNNTVTTATNLLSTSNNLDDDFNFILNTQNRHQNPMMSNETTVSSNSMNSMQNSPTNNMNPDWNLSGINQHLESVNGLLLDFNSMNDANRSTQSIDKSPDLNNVLNNQNSVMNSSNPWINRSNNMMNPRFPVLPPWHTSLPMYNSYLNNGNPYYNNMFNPYAAFIGFDFSNHSYSNMNSRNSMGINNDNQWMQNFRSGSDGHTNLNATNTEFSNMNSGSLQENTSNQGMNLSLTSDTILSQTNSLDLDDTNLSNELNSNIELFKENTFPQVETENNNEVEQSPGCYDEQISLPYSLEYKNDVQSIDFNDVEVTKLDENTIHNQQQQSLPQIQEYINQGSDNLEGIVNQTYRGNGIPSREIGSDLTNNRETEMSKLRQELADFTRQYSNDQISPTSQIPQGDEMTPPYLEAARSPK